MPEGGVEILLEEINRLHDVHIAIGEPISLFRIALLPPLIFSLPPSPDRSRDRDQRTVAPIGATFQPFKMMEIAESASQQEIGRNKVPAKFEQGGFTSGRRKGPQTLFPGTSPGNQCRHELPTKTRSAQRLLLYAGSPPPLPPGISSGSSAKTATLPRKKQRALDWMARCLS